MIVLDFLTGSSRTMSNVTDGSEINFRVVPCSCHQDPWGDSNSPRRPWW